MSLKLTPPATEASSQAPPPSPMAAVAPATLLTPADVVNLVASTSFLKRRRAGTHVVPQAGAAATAAIPTVPCPLSGQRGRHSQPNDDDEYIPRQIEDFGVEEDEVEDHDDPWWPGPAPYHIIAGGCQRKRHPRRARRRVNKVKIKISTTNRFKL
jgi:hypothetical protein